MPAHDPNIALPALVGRPALAPVDAFFQEHRRCGDLDGGVEDGRVWIACDCGADIKDGTPSGLSAATGVIMQSASLLSLLRLPTISSVSR